MSQSTDPGPLPVLDRADVESVLVTVLVTKEPEHQAALAETVTFFWNKADRPDELLSVTCYTSTDGRSVLTYAQWSSDAALRAWLDGGSGAGSTVLPDIRPDVEVTGPTPYRLTQVVRGSAVTDPDVVPTCFPVAFFEMPDADEARKWIDNLLEAEGETGGRARSYPGGIAANIHLSVEGTSVMIFSEWVSEKYFADHLSEVIEPVLDEVGDRGTDAAPTYRHHRSPVRPRG
ncbi:hypothetical protein AB0N07_41505 [Streptomyces sp. NPDC051172]|uniref:hypothetical protein n=1 Tax=Streptomyces sp. NPDC051172 TaxID=3155796 RepID=UPI00342803F6